MDKTRTKIVERVEAAIERDGRSRHEIALAAEMQPGHLYTALKGKRAIGKDVVEKLARVLNVSPASLLYGTDDAPMRGREPAQETARERRVRGFGEWMIALRPDVRAVVYRIGVSLSQTAGDRRLSVLPDKPATLGPDTDQRSRSERRSRSAGRMKRGGETG